MDDIAYMGRALELAKLGSGWVNPNPQVGAVIVKDGHIIGEGYHRKYGDQHAERNAITAAEAPLEGATIYVTLEPCCHVGKTPPCTEAIIQSGISRVVIGSDDPNPLVAGQGVACLQKAGIEVVTGVMHEACDKMNALFFHYITTKTPFVLMKYAMTLDGKISTSTGASKWITGEAAREDVHRLRGRYQGIMVGIGTVLADDPLLNCRIEGERDPVRIICDSKLRIPLESKIVQTAHQLKTVIASVSPDEAKINALQDLGCGVITTPSKDGRVDLRVLMKALGERKIDSVLLEGGAALNEAALESDIVNRLRCYIAMKLFGGADATTPIGGKGVSTPDEAFRIEGQHLEVIGNDICIEGEVV